MDSKFTPSPLTYRKCVFPMVGTQNDAAVSDCVQASRGTPAPISSSDFEISCRSGIARTLVQITLKHSGELIIKQAKPMYVSTEMCDSSRYSIFSPSLTGVHSEKVPILVGVRVRRYSLICIFLISGVVLCIFICLPC